MNVSLRAQIGIRGQQSLLNPIFLDVPAINSAAAWSGSYHVLAMGQHYDDYVVTGNLTTFQPIAGFPIAHPYERLTGKIRATGVTGNIGESIAAIFARRCLGTPIGDIAHVKSRLGNTRRKAPDYMMRLANVLPGPFAGILPAAFVPVWPPWMPVESKARTTQASANASRRDALRQLVTYWSLLSISQPGVLGYGLIISFKYQNPREVRASLIIPSNQPLLTQELQENGDDVANQTLAACLYGC
jgi:hypothetical protein